MSNAKHLARAALYLAVLSTLSLSLGAASVFVGSVLALKVIGVASLAIGAALGMYAARVLGRITSDSSHTPEQFAQLLLQTQHMVEATKRLKEDQHTLTQLLHHSPLPCCIKNSDNHVVFVNNAWVQSTGIAETTWLSQTAQVSAVFDSCLFALDTETLATGKGQQQAIKEPTLGDVTLLSAPLLDTAGVLAGTLDWLRLASTIGNHHNSISSLTDPLTQLGNHRFAVAWLQLAVSAQAQGIAVVVINLLRFSDLNRELGHDIGDALLAEIGVRLASLCDTNIQAARLERDHFALLLKSIPEPDVILARVAQIHQLLDLSFAPIISGPQPQFVIGLARIPEDAETPWTAIHTAQQDMKTQYPTPDPSNVTAI